MSFACALYGVATPMSDGFTSPSASRRRTCQIRKAACQPAGPTRKPLARRRRRASHRMDHHIRLFVILEGSAAPPFALSLHLAELALAPAASPLLHPPVVNAHDGKGHRLAGPREAARCEPILRPHAIDEGAAILGRWRSMYRCGGR